MKTALEVIDEVDAKFAAKFGRSYGGLIEEYRTEDADVVLVTVGGMSGTGKDAVDAARENGIMAGLIKLRFVRPFPAARVAKALAGKKAFAVVDRSVSFGWNCGPMYVETKAAVSDANDKQASFSAIGGLGGADLSYEHMLLCIEKLEAIKNEPGEKETLWLMND
jgi:pyruvate ferredoxin oxidoreductase alpha subunit/phenylglyoxylate dehydrogenase alpha subunit